MIVIKREICSALASSLPEGSIFSFFWRGGGGGGREGLHLRGFITGMVKNPSSIIKL